MKRTILITEPVNQKGIDLLKEQGYDVLTAILSNAAFMSLQSAACRVSFKNLATATMNGEVVA